MHMGIDVGSTGIKIVFTNNTVQELIWHTVVPTRPGQSQVVEELIQQGLDDCGLTRADIQRSCATGYGRHLISGVDQVVDEISANAAGMHALSNGQARTLINVGGQDVKIIHLDESGTVTDFRMNDKCAAGTGRFFEMAARILDTPLSGFHVPHVLDGVNINATCAVFAESEIVSLMAEDRDKDEIIQGINRAVAKRIATLMGHGAPKEPVYLDGGPALNQGLVECLEHALLCDIHVLDQPQFTVAFGALATP